MSFKKNNANRFLAGLLAVLMIVSMLPVTAITVLAAELNYTSTHIGYVKDEDGTLLEGARVYAIIDGVNIDAYTEIYYTNENGQFALRLVDGAEFCHVTVTLDGYKQYNAQKDFDTTMQIVLQKPKTITGKVINEEGNGVSATVKITGYNEEATSTDPDTGAFTLTSVYADEQYNITVSADGYKTYSGTLSYDGFGAIENIVLTEKNAISDFAFNVSSDTITYGFSKIYVAKSATYPDATVTYKSSDPNLLEVYSNGTVITKGVGDVVVTATVAESDDYLETKATLTLTIEKGTQTNLVWSNSVPTDLTWKDTFTNVLTGGVNGTATYESNSAIASVDANGKVTFNKPGTVKITGTMPGNANYNDATSSYEITVGKAAQEELVFNDKTPDAIFYGDTITNAIVSGGSTGGTVSYKSSNDTVATVDANGKITTHKSGNVTITATMAGNDLYNEVSATYDLTIYKAEQKADFLFAKGDSDKKMTYGEAFENAANGGENSPISYKSSDDSIASVDANGKVTAHKAGTVTITATNPADDRFNEKKISYKLTVNRADQEVVFAETSIPTLTWGDSYTNAATAKTEISYKSSDETVATVDGNGKLTIKKAGTVKITATAAKSDQYNEASKEYTITINKANQTVSFELGKNPTTTFNVNDNNYINKATTNAIDAGENDITCIFSIASGSEFVDGDIDEATGAFKIKGAGTIVVNVAYESNDRYKLASGSYTLTVQKANQTISFPDNTYSTVTGEAFTAPTASENGAKFGTGAITYAVKEDNGGIIKSIDENTGALVFTYKAGTATIIATKAADANYKATTAEYTVTTTEWTLDTNTEYYTMTGATVNNSGWFTGNVSVTAAEGYSLSYVQTNGNATWENILTDAVTSDGDSNVITFYVKDIATGKISAQVTENIKKDTVAPTASIEVESLTVWEKFLSIISFGAWNKDTADFTIISNDVTSQVAKVEYYVVYNNTELLDKSSLDAVSTWTEYNGAVSVDKDSVYVVYAKVTDTAGNYVYATTNGIVFDGTKPVADITLPATSTGYYTDDVIVDVEVNDAAPYSGIKEVSYKIFCDNSETENGSLYVYNNADPKYTDLISTWTGNITVNAVDNNSDNVKVEITVIDNAGNINTAEKSLKISAKDPEIAISYVDDPVSTGTNNGVVYYDTNRKAKIVITGRTTTWDDTLPVINITAVNSKGEPVANAYEISGWATVEGSKPDDATHTAYITFKGSAKYNFTVDYTDKANRTAAQAASNTFVVDHNNPTGTITVKNSTWDKLISALTFGLWSNESVNVSATYEDETSAIKSVEYFKANGDAIVTTAELDTASWTAFEGLKIDADEQFTVYLKITDYAGHYTYISTDGYIVDMTDSTIALTPDDPNSNDYYNEDVDVDVVVKDASPYSGIKKVEYWVEKDGVETQRETIFEFTTANPTKAQLEDEFTDTITVKANLNNSDNVKVYVQSTDNAGNVTTVDKALKIDVTAPVINVKYDTDAANEVSGRGYFKTNRTATITIVERTSTFDATAATNGIVITGVDAKGQPVALDLTSMISSWTTTEGSTPDEAVHTATISYTTDANYDFAISYTDKADNANEAVNTGSSVTPYKFTVDKTNPTATVSIDNNNWDTLLSVLTFGLWKNETVYVSATSDDVTSATKIEYYKTDSINPLSKEQLDAFTADKWTAYDRQIEIADDERLVVYLKVTDTAGNYVYRCSNGYIVDMTDAQITLTPDAPNANNVYNEDIKVLIDVNEPAPYSGIKKVEYWVTKDGVETQRDTLYEFDITNPTHAQLKSEYSKSITVKSELNNSSDVDVYVGVTDNAGNYVQETVALDIDITAPAISVSYDNNNEYKVDNNRGYFAANRVATVVITERTNHFDASAATEGIKITAKDAKNNVVIEDCTSIISAWNTVEGATPDEAKHTATISYTADANYTFEISYTDKADNDNSAVVTGDSVTPYIFTVDKKAPTGTVTVGELGTWDKLIEFLTFGLWSKDTVSVSGTSDDVTSPIESVSYYKTAETTAKTAKQLAELDETSWTKFTGFDVPANEQFTVYIRIVDFAGNTTYISTNGIIVDSVKPEFQPALEDTKPEITLAPVENDLNGLYKDDVTIAVKVVDPITGETYSGLKEIRYEITNMSVKTQEGVLYSFADELGENVPTQDKLRQIWEKKDAIVVDSELNNSNDVKVKVYAVDNAANDNEDEIALKIDITEPTIDITYDNNDGDTNFTESTYFKANRTATIVITERNFNKDKVEIKITNTDEVIPTLSGWKTETADGNGDETKHTATITYSADGDYTFAIAYTDEAGNDNEKVDYGETLAPEKFTVDKTLPTVSVTYDNNEALNGNYYKAQRIATIVVTEHNFETSRVKIALKATDNGAEAALPTVSNWSSNGDVHTATITYTADSLYTFDFDYNDKAGNATADIAEQAFYVDKTNPAVSISKIVDQSANNDEGNIGFVVTATDTNFDVFTPVLTVTDIKGGSTKLNVGATTDIANGKTYTVENLDADGIYRITCTVVDKAGNAYSEVTLQRADGSTYVEKRAGEDTLVTFSVNRDGSTYEINENTASLIEKYYVQNVTDNVVIVETNADVLNEYKVTLNGKELAKNTDYTVAESGGNGQWMKYTYTVNKSLFADEGEYKLVVSSKDKAENDAFSDVKDTTINFVVDRTAPIVTITGMAKDGRYQTESQKVTLVPTDDGGALKTLIVRLVDEDGKVIGEPIIDLAGEALEKALEDGAGKIEFTIAEGMYQNIQIICNDCAVDEDGKTNTYDETITNVTVTPNGFMIFWANKPLRWGSIAGVILLTAAIIFFIFFKKRKKEN